MPDSKTYTPTRIANDLEDKLPYAIAAQEDRCAPRQPLSIPARLRLSCSSGFAVEVTDMSLAGFACDALLAVEPGTRCWLTLPELGALEAEVVRHSKHGVGCAFKDLLNLAVLNHYVARYPAG